MDRSPICPFCYSKFPDIRGLVSKPGLSVGRQCDDDWHRGVSYDPDNIILTDFDQEFLAEQLVKWE